MPLTGIRSISVAAFFAAALLAATAGAGTDPSPRQVVERLHDTLLTVMRNARSLGYAGRYDKLAPVIRNVFHLRYMSSIVAGYHWRKFTPAQQDALTDAFGRMTIATYARRFDGFSGEKFRFLSDAEGQRQTALVRSQIVPTDGKPVELDYRLRRMDGRWAIIDVHPTGSISELATRRAEYSAVIRRKGLDALLQLIDGKIKAFRAEGS